MALSHYASIILLQAVFFIFILCKCISIPSYNELKDEAWKHYDKILEMRRYLHQHAEQYFEEFETSEYIQKQLSIIGVNYTSGLGVNTNDPNQRFGTGIIAQLGTGHPPCIALRADIDALNLPELVDLPFKSINEGYMHACGHDAHAAMLLGAAKILKAHEHELKGTVKLFFQPAEEGGGGAAMMINEGALTNYPPVQHVYAFHVTGELPTGTILSMHGITGAGMDDFVITIEGKGGHAAMHHLTIDPIPAAIAIMRALNDIYARELYFQVETAGVISVTFFKTSSKTNNVIPDTVTIGGTLRSLNKELMGTIRNRIVNVTNEIAESYQCTASIRRQQNVAFPPMQISEELFHDYYENIHPPEIPYIFRNDPVMGGEDFAFYAEAIPCLFLAIGSGSGSEIPGHPPTSYSAHNSHYAVDERVMPQGAALHALIALKKLAMLNNETSSLPSPVSTGYEKFDEL